MFGVYIEIYAQVVIGSIPNLGLTSETFSRNNDHIKQ